MSSYFFGTDYTTYKNINPKVSEIEKSALIAKNIKIQKDEELKSRKTSLIKLLIEKLLNKSEDIKTISQSRKQVFGSDIISYYCLLALIYENLSYKYKDIPIPEFPPGNPYESYLEIAKQRTSFEDNLTLINKVIAEIEGIKSFKTQILPSSSLLKDPSTSSLMQRRSKLSNTEIHIKYLKYKNKYLQLKNNIIF
jgi:hypothetical protein